MPLPAVAEFTVPFQGTLLRGNRKTPPSPAGTVLLLQGGGTSTAQGFEELREFLHAHKLATVSFDFVGHGRTGGPQLGTTLEERVQQVIAVIKTQALQSQNLTLIGFSMGAYVAVKTVSEIGIPRLCLVIPAAYDAKSYTTPFGQEFSKIIRAPQSWAQSDAFELIGAYSGHLLVISAAKDQVVPPEIPQKYMAGAKMCASANHFFVQRAGHNLSEHYVREPQAREDTYVEIASLCQRGDA